MRCGTTRRPGRLSAICTRLSAVGYAIPMFQGKRVSNFIPGSAIAICSCTGAWNPDCFPRQPRLGPRTTFPTARSPTICRRDLARFCCEIVEACAPHVAAIKPQLAFFEARGLDGMRALLRSTQQLRRFEPAGDPLAWDAAARRAGLH